MSIVTKKKYTLNETDSCGISNNIKHRDALSCAQFNLYCNGKTNGVNIRKIAIFTITIISFFETTHPMTTSTASRYKRGRLRCWRRLKRTVSASPNITRLITLPELYYYSR